MRLLVEVAVFGDLKQSDQAATLPSFKQQAAKVGRLYSV